MINKKKILKKCVGKGGPTLIDTQQGEYVTDPALQTPPTNPSGTAPMSLSLPEQNTGDPMQSLGLIDQYGNLVSDNRMQQQTQDKALQEQKAGQQNNQIARQIVRSRTREKGAEGKLAKALNGQEPSVGRRGIKVVKQNPIRIKR